MGFQIRKVQSFLKTFQTNIIVLDFEIKFFFHCFATFEVQKGIVDR
jgi:hypothetical protein